MTTMSDVAKLAGVSNATVSRALKNPEKLSSSTLEKVNKALISLNYISTYGAQISTHSASKIITVLMPDSNEICFSEITKGIESKAQELGYKVFYCKLSEKNTENSFEHLLIFKHSEGLLIMHKSLQRELQSLNIQRLPPIVLIGEFHTSSTIYSVMIDNMISTYQAIDYLVRLGHEKIAQVIYRPNSSACQLKQRGFDLATKRASLNIKPEYTISADSTLDAGKQALDELMKLDDPPTAVFCHNDDLAIGVMQAAKNAGKSIPRDLSVIGFGNCRYAEYVNPALTSVNVPNFQIGSEALDTLCNVIKGILIQPKAKIFEAELIKRESVSYPKSKYEVSSIHLSEKLRLLKFKRENSDEDDM